MVYGFTKAPFCLSRVVDNVVSSRDRRVDNDPGRTSLPVRVIVVSAVKAQRVLEPGTSSCELQPLFVVKGVRVLGCWGNDLWELFSLFADLMGWDLHEPWVVLEIWEGII
jgi:hypothetical protein